MSASQRLVVHLFYADTRDYLVSARWHFGLAVQAAPSDRRRRTTELLFAAHFLVRAEHSRDLARVARRAASTQPTADGGDEE